MKTLKFSDKLLSIKDVSEILNCSEATIKRYIYSKELPSLKVGSARRIKVDDVKAFINNSKKQKESVKNTDLKIIPGYMGIKTQILDHIHLEINKIVKKGQVVLDIFAGSGVVGYELKRDFTVYSNDIEQYSCVINRLLLDNSITQADIKKLNIDTFKKNYKSNYKRISEIKKPDLNKYKENHQLAPYILFTAYFSGTYFGGKQSRQIDSLRFAIDQTDKKYKNLLLSCLIYACYQTVSSVGSHFAQPKKTKTKNQSSIDKKRSQEVDRFFFRKLEEVEKNLYTDKKKNLVFCEDFNSLLNKNFLKKVTVTYIDPPYTIDHYSRFYHILNTLVLYDYPEKEGNGLYRDDRYQSKFCIKSTALDELDSLVKKLSKLGSKIVMSYSDSHRSLITADDITKTLKKYYKASSVKTPIKIEYIYSGFGRTSFNKANELLFVATKPK